MNVSSFMGLQTALRGLLAQQRGLDVTAHNLANANTVGYTRQEASLVAAEPLALQAGALSDGAGAYLGQVVEVEAYRRLRDTFLDLQYRGQNMALGGHETTARALTWAWHLLGQHPAAAAALAAELDAVLDGRPVTAADRPRLRYAEGVVTEALRLYPPLWVLGRVATEACALGEYRVEAGTIVLVSPWVVQRDPRHFDRPEAFDPHRWADGLARRLPRYAYFPFGGGPRACIGAAFAMTEAVLLLATIARRFRLAPVPAHPVAPRASITLRTERGVPMVLHRR